MNPLSKHVTARGWIYVFASESLDHPAICLLSKVLTPTGYDLHS